MKCRRSFSGQLKIKGGFNMRDEYLTDVYRKTLPICDLKFDGEMA